MLVPLEARGLPPGAGECAMLASREARGLLPYISASLMTDDNADSAAARADAMSS